MKRAFLKTPGRIMLSAFMLAGSLYAARPYHPWVERVSIYQYPRQIKVALHEDMWLIYDYPYCTLHMAWQGGSGGGTMANAKYIRWKNGPHTATQFEPSGTIYFKNEKIDAYYPSYSAQEEISAYYGYEGFKFPTDYRPWRVSAGGDNLNVKVKFRGYFTKIGGEDKFQLNFSLVLPDGNEIKVEEIPEYTGNGAGLIRVVKLTGIPAGHEVHMHLEKGGSVWKVSGDGEMTGDEMIMQRDGTVTVNAFW